MPGEHGDRSGTEEDRAARELQSSILSFLDAVDAEAEVLPSSAALAGVDVTACDASGHSEAPTQASQNTTEPSVGSFSDTSLSKSSLVSSPVVPTRLLTANMSQPQQAMQVYSEVKAKMAALHVGVAQRDKTIRDLKDSLSRHKQDAAAAQQHHAQEMAAQLLVQRAEFDAQVKRHLDFIDQLVSDKGVLSDKCEDLATEFQLLQLRLDKQLEEGRDKHERELKKQRESIMAAERIRRDNWMQDKSREIKQMTVKGLQPEIERLLAKHKAELKRMEEVNAQEMKRQREVLAEAHERSTNEVRERLLLERERALEREREMSSVRLHEQSERFGQQLQAQRARMAEDMAQERERIETLHRAEKQRIEDMYGMQLVDNSRKLAAAQHEWSEKEEEARRRHAAEISRLREQLEIEKEQWMLQMSERTAKERRAADEQTWNAFAKQRDEEIELVIVRLEEEAEVTRARLEREADQRGARSKEEHAAQVHAAKEAEREVMDKYLALSKEHSAADERLRAAAARTLELEEELASRVQALQRAECTADKAVEEVAIRVESVRAEYQQKLERLEGELSRTEADARESSAMHEEKVKQLNARHVAELDALNVRVRAAMERKDADIAALRSQVAGTEACVAQYEELLDRQRHELLA